MWRLAGAVVLLIALSAAQNAAAGTGRIAFTSNRDGNPELYVLDAGTGRVMRVTHTRRTEFDPTWSPSGAQLAFARGGSIWVLRLSTGAVTKFVKGCFFDSPDWAPDGSRISFDVSLPRAESIWLKALPTGPETGINADGIDPSWSPDGTAIVFRRFPASIWIKKLSDGSAVRLTSDEGSAQPARSPDGSKIAFSRSSDI